MSDNKKNIPTSNLILLITSILCVIATIVVFIFYSDHQSSKKGDVILSSGEQNDESENDTSANPSPTDAPPSSNPDEILDVIIPEETTVTTRFNPPTGFKGVEAPANSFGAYLQNFPLRKYDAKPLRYNSDSDSLEEDKSTGVASVLDIDLIHKRNLQIAPNSLILLYSKYLYNSQLYSDISFKLSTTPVFECDYNTWTTGGRLNVQGNKITWCKEHTANCGHKDVELGTNDSTFKWYMQNVMLYTSMASFKSNLYKVQKNDANIGDVIFFADSNVPSIIVDMATDSSGNKIYIAACGGTPACEIHILKNEKNADMSPWQNLSDLPLNAEIYRF